MTIWKWTLNAADIQEIEMPIGKILAVQVQDCEPQLWATVNPDNGREKRFIATYGTGHSIPKMPGQYIATFQLYDGALVLHAFEVTP